MGMRGPPRLSASQRGTAWSHRAASRPALGAPRKSVISVTCWVTASMLWRLPDPVYFSLTACATSDATPLTARAVSGGDAGGAARVLKCLLSSDSNATVCLSAASDSGRGEGSHGGWQGWDVTAFADDRGHRLGRWKRALPCLTGHDCLDLVGAPLRVEHLRQVRARDLAEHVRHQVQHTPAGREDGPLRTLPHNLRPARRRWACVNANVNPMSTWLAVYSGPCARRT